MSQETSVDQIQFVEDVEASIIHYSTRLIERTIERALDIIYEESNDMDAKIHEWRHSTDKISILKN